MTSMEGYTRYETKLEEFWGLWIAALREGPRAPDFLKKDRFLNGFCEPVCKKVRVKVPTTYEEAITIAQRTKKKLQIHCQLEGSLTDHEGCP